MPMLEGKMGMIAGIGAALAAGTLALGAAWVLADDDEEEISQQGPDAVKTSPRPEAGSPDNDSLKRTLGALSRTMNQLKAQGKLTAAQFAAYEALPLPKSMNEFNEYANQLDPLLAQNPETGPAFQALFELEQKKSEEIAQQAAKRRVEFEAEVKHRESLKAHYLKAVQDGAEYEERFGKIKAAGLGADGPNTKWLELDEWVLDNLADPTNGWGELMQAAAEQKFRELKTDLDAKYSPERLEETLALTKQSTKFTLQGRKLSAKNPQYGQQFVMVCNALVTGRVPQEQMPQIQGFMQQMLGMLTEADNAEIEQEVESQVPGLVLKQKEETIAAVYEAAMTRYALQHVLSSAHMKRLLELTRQVMLADDATGPQAALAQFKQEMTVEYAAEYKGKLDEFAALTEVAPEDPALAVLARVQAKKQAIEKSLEAAVLQAQKLHESITTLALELDKAKPPAGCSDESAALYAELRADVHESTGAVGAKLLAVQSAWTHPEVAAAEEEPDAEAEAEEEPEEEPKEEPEEEPEETKEAEVVEEEL